MGWIINITEENRNNLKQSNNENNETYRHQYLFSNNTSRDSMLYQNKWYNLGAMEVCNMCHESKRILLCQNYFIYIVCNECLFVLTLNKKSYHYMLLSSETKRNNIFSHTCKSVF